MNLKRELYEKAKLGKSSFLDDLSKNEKLSFDIRDMDNDQIISVYDENEEFIEEFEFDEYENYLNPIEKNTGYVFTLYNRLTSAQRIHLLDFTIINSIENACDKDFKQEEKERLLEVISDAYLEDESHTDRATIADEIVRAYANGEVSLETLEEASNSQILDCIVGLGCFDSLEEELEEYEEDEEDLE